MNKRKKTMIFIRRFALRGLLIIPLLGALAFAGMIIPKPVADQEYIFSKQFNGRSFVNEEGKISYSAFWDFLRWQSYEFKNKWPQSIPNIYEPQLPPHVQEGEVVITFINHATFLIQTSKLNILTDPVFAARVSPFKWVGPKRVHPPGLSVKKLPPIHAVIISHNHYDHLDVASLKKISKKHKPQVYVPLGDKKWLENAGVKNVSEMDWWQHLELQGHKFHFLPAKHNSGRSLVSENSSLWGSFLIELPKKGPRIYFGGDTAYADHFKKIFEHFGPMDLSILPIGAYLPRDILKDVHMNPEDAVLAHKDLNSRYSVAMHFGTFQLSDESYWDPLIDFNKAIIIHDVPETEFRLPSAGQTLRFDLKK